MLNVLWKWLFGPRRTVSYGGKLYDADEYEVVQCDYDAPPMHDMGPGYVWEPDMILRRKR